MNSPTATDPPTEPVAAVHLDAVGGVAGDMFVAALLDARPDLWWGCEEAISAMGPPPGLRYALTRHADGVLTGLRFGVEAPVNPERHHHHHVRWSDIRAAIQRADIAPAVRATATGVFARLAEAEAAVHGIAAEDVEFHEVGAWDSIVDIVAAAAIIEGLGPCRWTIGAIPRGRGLVRTAHGMLPVPAPAAARLLTGYMLVDDGEDGERVTPTGAAILSHLGATQSPDSAPRRLIGIGQGFGTRTFASRSNVLRASLFGREAATAASDEVEVLRCEIDDQSPEDLAAAIEHIRTAEGVLDVCQWPVHGKKGRIGMAVQVLVRPEAADRVAALCLSETTSLGIRRRRERRTVVAREAREEEGLRVKIAHRPGATTAKVEIDDVAAVAGHRRRHERRARAEALALAREGGDGD